jgi:hypothetical protein
MPILIILCYFGFRYVVFFAIVLLTLLDVGNYVIFFSIGIFIAKNFHLLTAENWINSKFYNYRYGIYLFVFLLLGADQFYFIITKEADLHISNTFWDL